MSWHSHVKSAENLLLSSRIPPSTEIITLIKKVNPTKLKLPKPDKQIGYDLKAQLQNMLLENYGTSFHLAPHPYNPVIVLIKHQMLPSIDACHADIRRLSTKALDAVATPFPSPPDKTPAIKAKPDDSEDAPPTKRQSAKTALTGALQLLKDYEYESAKAILASIRIRGNKEVSFVLEACRLLVEEMGAYDCAIEMLLLQPKQVLSVEKVREILALSYYHNGQLPEAKVLFELFAPAELGKEALHAYADISLKDGNLLLAYHLLNAADEKSGLVTAFTSLRNEVEQCMQTQAEPLFQRAKAAFEGNELSQATALARETLEYYPNHQKARDLMVSIDAMKTAADIAKLWRMFETCEQSERRIELLGKLSELDRGCREKIRDLIAEEKRIQRRKSADDRLSLLQQCAERRAWSECFDIVRELSRQEESRQQYRQALSVSPFFAMLGDNRRLQRLSEEKAKEIWLTFVRVSQSMLAGQNEGCLESMEAIRPYFQAYRLFKENHGVLLRLEQKKAGDKIRTLLARLDEACCSFAEANKIVAALREPFALVPAEDRAHYERVLEDGLRRLAPQPVRDTVKDMLWEQYRRALQTGNEPKAQSLQEQLDDQAECERIRAEIREKFSIDRQPIAISISEDLAVDLTCQSPALTLIGGTDRHVFMRENDHNVILVDLAEKVGAKLTSPYFENLEICDIIPERGVFLFVDRMTPEKVWRAVITETECRFTAVIEIGRDLCLQCCGSIDAIYLSSEDSCEYYVAIYNEDSIKSARIVKQNLNQKFHAMQAKKIRANLSCTHRLSSTPDRFIIGTKRTIIVDENLKWTAGSELTPRIYGVDRAEGQIYTVHGMHLNVYDAGLNFVKVFPASVSAGLFNHRCIMGICKGSDTVITFLGDDQARFYDLKTNKFSERFRYSNMLFSRIYDNWFYYQYCEDSSTLKLKDITFGLENSMVWEEPIRPGMDEMTMIANICKLTGKEIPPDLVVGPKAPSAPEKQFSADDDD
jgi:hypothetical protein